MNTKQINVKLSEKMYSSASDFVEKYGFRNIQELITEALREKIFRSSYDNSFSSKEIELIEKLVEKSIKEKKLVDYKGLSKALK